MNDWEGMNWELEEMDELIPLVPVGSVEYQANDVGGCLWDVSVTHDADGHGVGVTVAGGQLVLTVEDASRMGIGLLRAAAMAVAWDRVRAKAN